MTIGIDIRLLGNPIKSGIEEYTENLLEHLVGLDKNIQFKLFFSSYSGELSRYGWFNNENVKLYKFPYPNRILFSLNRIINRPFVDRMMGGVDVFFSPHFFLAPLSPTCKRVTTFHDLSFERLPALFSVKRRIWHGLEMTPRRQALASNKIIAVSESTKVDLTELYGIDPQKIDVIYSGISSSVYRPSKEELKEFSVRENLPRRFILFLGKFEPRKNIKAIIKAFNSIKEDQANESLFLVIIGSRGWLYESVFHEISQSKFRNHILVREKIKDENRKFYYSLCEVFLYPSLLEGFGLPIAEAIRCGAKVITSANSSLPEVARYNCIVIDPHNIDEIVKAIVLSKRYQIKTLIPDVFTWERAAQLSLETIKSSL